jgi:transcriptional regulator with XRE-family HTH domain
MSDLAEVDPEGMASSEPPAVARRRLRLALRKLREEGGFTQAQVAEALHWSLSKVNRIESGEVGISYTDLMAFVNYLGVTDDALIGRLVEDAQASRGRRGWWDEPRFREHLNKATRQLFQFESEASAIRFFNPSIFPGLVQTRGYAEAILGVWDEQLGGNDVTARLEARMRRFEHVFERPDPPRYQLIIDESVVLRDVGGPAVMVGQLQWVLDLMLRQLITVRVVPLAEPVGLAMLGPFMILEIDDESSAVLYRESLLRDEIVQSPREVLDHQRIFDQMWKNGLTEEASTRLITARAALLLASLDRSRPMA